MFAAHAVIDVGLQHGVVANTTQLNAVARHHARIVFEVLAHFGFAFIFKQRFQLGNHPVAIQLLRRIQIIVRNW
ncbi:Uncharacterised protein [Vibrio cholerae]|uniref:Uncharacterized protein n=1 Tax=Vibrio cholerae TaxID=666 RepID=A0A655Z1R9_VIBCL|nr:Uncharacterised protein [Vibrio cholerae]